MTGTRKRTADEDRCEPYLNDVQTNYKQPRVAAEAGVTSSLAAVSVLVSSPLVSHIRSTLPRMLTELM